MGLAGVWVNHKTGPRCGGKPVVWRPGCRALRCQRLFDRLRAQALPGETFRVLKEKEQARWGESRTRRLVLEAWKRPSTSEESGTPEDSGLLVPFPEPQGADRGRSPRALVDSPRIWPSLTG